MDCLQAFRIQLDAKRKIFDHLSPEEQAQFKESIRVFRHPKHTAPDREVILTDKETAARQERPPPQTPHQQHQQQQPAKRSWLLNKILEHFPPTYDPRQALFLC